MRYCFKKKTFFVTGLILGCVIICALLFPTHTNIELIRLKNIIFDYFSWIYVLFTAFFLFFLLCLSFSKYGDLVLGSSEVKPEFSFFTWLAMLFSTGMGVGFMYFGVSEPILHLSSPVSDGEPKKALLYTIFHWALHPWAIYGSLALILAYCSHKLNLPLSLRSILFPLLGNKIHGRVGRLVDIITVLAIVFGIITTFGLGAMQLNGGLKHLGLVNSISLDIQISCIIFVCFLGCASAISGVRSGMRFLSNLNLMVVFILLMFFMFLGDTKLLISLILDNLGNYLNNILNLSFNTFSYEKESITWFKDWTVFYWAWWVSWAPFVSLFIARISKGRTLREFVFGVLVAPSLLSILWFTIFGNSAIEIDIKYGGVLTKLSENPEILLFQFFEYYPYPFVISCIAIAVIMLFFITSVDSGILVLSNLLFFTQKRVSYSQGVFWMLVFISITSSLLYSGGISAIQVMTIIMALPLLMYIMLACVLFFLYLSRTITRSNGELK